MIYQKETEALDSFFTVKQLNIQRKIIITRVDLSNEFFDIEIHEKVFTVYKSILKKMT